MRYTCSAQDWLLKAILEDTYYDAKDTSAQIEISDSPALLGMPSYFISCVETRRVKCTTHWSEWLSQLVELVLR